MGVAEELQESPLMVKGSFDGLDVDAGLHHGNKVG